MKRYFAPLAILLVLAFVAGSASTQSAFRLFKGPTLQQGDFTVSDGYLIGPSKTELLTLGALSDGSAESVLYVDDTPDGEWAATTGATVTADTSIYKVGSKSLKIAFSAAAAAGAGAVNDITNDDLEANESVGLWVYSTTQLVAGDLQLELDDDDASTDPTVSFPAIQPRLWTWVELDISSCDGGGGDCDVVDTVTVELTSQGATTHGAFDLYLDAAYKWDADNEEALGVDLVDGGVLSVLAALTAETGANTLLAQVEYTDYIVHYESGNDFLVLLTDESANSGLALVNHQ